MFICERYHTCRTDIKDDNDITLLHALYTSVRTLQGHVQKRNQGKGNGAHRYVK